MKMLRLAPFFVVLTLVAMASACSDDESTTSTTTTTTNVGFTVDTPDGQVSLSLSGELPPNWPDDFPVPSGAEPAGSGSLGGTTSTGFVGVYSTSGTPEEAYDFYRDNDDLAVTGSSSIGSGTSFVGNVRFSGDPSGNVTVVPYNGQTLIIVLLSQSSSGTTLAPSDTAVTS